MHTEAQTFARTITVCADCGKECQQIEMPGTIKPCGHKANLKIIANPALEG